jgi:hypothetical protein
MLAVRALTEFVRIRVPRRSFHVRLSVQNPYRFAGYWER